MDQSDHPVMARAKSGQKTSQRGARAPAIQGGAKTAVGFGNEESPQAGKKHATHVCNRRSRPQ